jgi:hypothetical protein
MAGKKTKDAAALQSTSSVLKRHFTGMQVASLVTASREYPVPARVDLQRAVDELLPEYSGATQSGIHAEFAHETLTLGHFLANGHTRVVVGPLQYEEIDIGEALPIRCVRRALWLAREGRTPFALILGPATRFGAAAAGTSIEIVVPPGEKGAGLARRVLDQIDKSVKNASSYRGRVISLGSADRYTGAMGAIRVHKLKTVNRDQLVLPKRTIALLDRNVIGFIEQRDKLRKLGLPVKKGLLFYGHREQGKPTPFTTWPGASRSIRLC